MQPDSDPLPPSAAVAAPPTDLDPPLRGKVPLRGKADPDGLRPSPPFDFTLHGTPFLPDLVAWMEKHHQNLRVMADAKADAYGATDLLVMARGMQAIQPNLDEAQALEAAIAFYALGKLGRVLSAFGEGKPSPEDSWLDLETYALMAQKVMETGSWP